MYFFHVSILFKVDEKYIYIYIILKRMNKKKLTDMWVIMKQLKLWYERFYEDGPVGLFHYISLVIKTFFKSHVN